MSYDRAGGYDDNSDDESLRRDRAPADYDPNIQAPRRHRVEDVREDETRPFDQPVRAGEVRQGIRAIREEYDLISSMVESLEGIISPILGKGDAGSIAKHAEGLKAVAGSPDVESSIGQDLHEVFDNFRTLRNRVSNIIERVRL